MNITQETFDEYVKENIDDLDMAPEEAVEDVVETCTLQGANLYFIVKKNVESDGRHLVLHLLDNLLKYPSNESLEAFLFECKTFECRHWACMAGFAFEKINKEIGECLETKNTEKLNLFLKALHYVLRDQPDWVTPAIVINLQKCCEYWLENQDWSLIRNISCVVHAASVMHEKNRATMMTHLIQGILCRIFKPLQMDNFEPSADYYNALTDTCKTLQVQMIDDDNRQAGSDAHGRAKRLVNDHDLLKNSILLSRKLVELDNNDTVNELIALISDCLVCNDFCKQAAELGAAHMAAEVMRQHMNSPVKVKCCLNLLKNLFGNDDVKHKLIAEVGIHEDVILVLQLHFGITNTALAALRCITSLTLRNPDCARAVVNKCSAADAIVNALKCHAKNITVTRAGLMAARNCVVRAPELRPKFLQLELELIANEALKIHKLDEAKACLRDLGCEVDLKEKWTGKGHQLVRAETTVLKEMNIT